jgi:hypothetical protein
MAVITGTVHVGTTPHQNASLSVLHHHIPASLGKTAKQPAALDITGHQRTTLRPSSNSRICLAAIRRREPAALTVHAPTRLQISAGDYRVSHTHSNTEGRVYPTALADLAVVRISTAYRRHMPAHKQ